MTNRDKPTLRAETRTLPEIIKKIRSGLGETQKKFGDRFGVSAPLVCQWESGYREPSASVFIFVLEHELAQVKAETVERCIKEIKHWQWNDGSIDGNDLIQALQELKKGEE